VQYRGCPHLVTCLLCLLYDHEMETEYSPQMLMYFYQTTFCNTSEGRSETEGGFWVVLHVEVIAPFDWGDTEDYQRGSCLLIVDKEKSSFSSSGVSNACESAYKQFLPSKSCSSFVCFSLFCPSVGHLPYLKQKQHYCMDKMFSHWVMWGPLCHIPGVCDPDI
jgi:hypothetical protein